MAESETITGERKVNIIETITGSFLDIDFVYCYSSPFEGIPAKTIIREIMRYANDVMSPGTIKLLNPRM